MADRTSIEWTQASWNPVTGCSKVPGSPGCDNCYAETFAERWRGIPGHHFANGFDVTLRPERLDQPLRWRRPRRIFVNSMSDLLHDSVPDEYIARVFAVMALAQRHTFQVLTKRHGRMRALLRDPAFRQIVADQGAALQGLGPSTEVCRTEVLWPLPNVWLGVSVENQKWADIRVPVLLDTPAAVRWLSCEPLLGPVDLGRLLVGRPSWGEPHPEPSSPAGIAVRNLVAAPRIAWVVVGGESGHGARPIHPDWARALRDQCQAADVPYFFKQWGEYGPLPRVRSDGRYGNSRRVTVANDGTVYQPGDLAWPDGPRVGEAIRASHDRARLHAMYRVGKGVAGRELDGRTWDEYPGVTTAVA